jgi:phage tail-like protein
MAGAPSSYLQHLPEIFRGKLENGDPVFLGDYLKIFEGMLSGRADAVVAGENIQGLEQRVAKFVDYLDPALTPVDDPNATAGATSEFLTYLASWVALALDQNWDLQRKREWLRQIVPLYKRRGTKAGLTAYLNMFVGRQVRVSEPPGGFIVAGADNSTVGVDTFIAGGPAYFFRVLIQYGFPGGPPFEIAVWSNLSKGTRAIVDLEKPAHTYYTLDARAPGFIIASRSTIARDSLIWQNSEQAFN